MRGLERVPPETTENYFGNCSGKETVTEQYQKQKQTMIRKFNEFLLEEFNPNYSKFPEAFSIFKNTNFGQIFNDLAYRDNFEEKFQLYQYFLRGLRNKVITTIIIEAAKHLFRDTSAMRVNLCLCQVYRIIIEDFDQYSMPKILIFYTR